MEVTQQVVELKCPGCGSRVSINQSNCEYCHSPIVITSFHSMDSYSKEMINKYANSYREALASNPDNQVINKAIGMCYLKLKLYDKARTAFEKAIEDNFDDSEVFFYAAICLLNGKKAFLCSRENINKILEYLEAATMIESRGIYYYFMSYIKYDFFARKRYNTSPNYIETLETANEMGVSDADISSLFELLAVERPEAI